MSTLVQTLVCSKCLMNQPVDNFSRRSDRPRGYVSRCKTCWTAYRTPVDTRKAVLIRHGMTQEEYDSKFSAQLGLCMICERPQRVGGLKQSDRLDIDHDHITGELRDLLCRSCNIVLGHMQDNPVLLRKAADYLEKWNA